MVDTTLYDKFTQDFIAVITQRDERSPSRIEEILQEMRSVAEKDRHDLLQRPKTSALSPTFDEEVKKILQLEFELAFSYMRCSPEELMISGQIGMYASGQLRLLQVLKAYEALSWQGALTVMTTTKD